MVSYISPSQGWELGWHQPRHHRGTFLALSRATDDIIQHFWGAEGYPSCARGSFLTLLQPPQVLPLLTCQAELPVLSKNLHLDKQILIKRIYSRYGDVFTSTDTRVEFALVAKVFCVCVFTCAQGLLVPQGLELDCYEQMAIIAKAQKAPEGGGGGVVPSSHYLARLISATWMW